MIIGIITNHGLEAHLHLLYDLDDFPKNTLNFGFHNWKMNREHYLPHRTTIRIKMKCAGSQWAFYSLFHLVLQGTAFFNDKTILISRTVHISTV